MRYISVTEYKSLSVSQVSVQVVDVNEDPEFVRDNYTARIFSIAFYKSPVVYVQV